VLITVYPTEYRLTWGKGLLELLGLLSVVDQQGVEVSRTSDLEFRNGGGLGRSLGLGGGGSVGLEGGLLDSGGCLVEVR
jgi:hypothetical protein